ncbi:MAG: glycogen debranching protein GlgX, partial [Verrucomicrobiae bacterium]|nr:glycogen debranching protein GlgX [Verrucomicrobiae bacterium]
MPLASDQLEIRPGKPWPLGATPLPDGRGVNFSVFSQHGDAVDLILFDREAPDREAARVRVTGRTGHLRHVEVRGVEAGQVYGYRVHGPWMPEWGLLFNPDKLLLDPYARRVLGPSAAHPAMIGKSEHGRDRRDSVAVAPKGVVVDSSGFDWGDDRPPEVPPDQSVVYELHVKGFTRQMPGVPEDLRGTYAGLGSDAAIAYLKALGITAVQLMPVHQHLDDGFLVDRGLVNYWGYNTIGFFAPEARYAATGDPVSEFKSMVRALHAAGIEVILDVVFNHTGEAGPDGPLCLLRGFENLGYYRTNLKRPEDYTDVTGCGNTVDLTHPMGLRLVIDSLRYWVEEMRVDGFRFDLAVTLGREPSSFNPQSAFFKAVQLDPVLAGVKLVAEPWDLGRGGYQVGAFPPGWHELNGRFRDCVRRFWRGEGGVLAEFASRITGSEDLFRHNGRTPLAGVNFFASHDGFTLRDLVSYADKHNEANGEGNRDGDNHNLSANYGIEGPTHDPALEDLRSRQCRNFFATLMLSQGVPFILAGDEIGRTQRGNNNA